MPKLFEVTLKQGSKTSTVQIEALNYQAAISFCEAVTTQRVARVSEVFYMNDIQPPPDDFNYFKNLKCIIKANSKAWQLQLHNIKKTLNANEIETLIKQHLKVDGLTPDSIFVASFKT